MSPTASGTWVFGSQLVVLFWGHSGSMGPALRVKASHLLGCSLGFVPAAQDKEPSASIPTATPCLAAISPLCDRLLTLWNQRFQTNSFCKLPWSWNITTTTEQESTQWRTFIRVQVKLQHEITHGERAYDVYQFSSWSEEKSELPDPCI